MSQATAAINVQRVTLAQAKPLIEDALFAKLVPFIRSSPGIGKSALGHEIAEKYRLKVIDLRLSQCDPTDLNGFPWIDPATRTATYVPMDMFPTERTPIPEGYEGWLLFLDEFNSATQAVQAAAYKLVLDRMAGMNKLHSKVMIIAAGNLDDDGAITNPLSSASVSRVLHLEIVESLKCWINWADKKGVESVLTAFLEYRAACFYTFNKAHPDQVYACPRTWEFADRLVKRFHKNTGNYFPLEKMPLMAGCISEGVAKELHSFIAYQAELPSLADIVKRPKEVDIPSNPGIRYALGGALADYATVDNIGQLVQYIERMPVENQVFALRSMIRRKTEIKGNPFISKWARDNADFFF